ncbi:MAG TPA: OmpA family protein, partial [Bacteroidia bacterium]|nr:OmpA family protein [Bacteroidia bacterium]
DDITGEYYVTIPGDRDYSITARKPDYLFYSERMTVPAVSKGAEVTKDIALSPYSQGETRLLVFFDFDKATLRPESTSELQRLIALLNDVPTLKIEISGHTDAKGAADYNQKLSQNRAKAVVDYLVKAGIAADRLTFAGYGKDQPIATNDTDEGRQLNRRTEFKIISK